MSNSVRALALMIIFACGAPQVLAQLSDPGCGTLSVSLAPATARTGDNQITGTATIWPDLPVPGGTWTVTLTTQLLFRPSLSDPETVVDEEERAPFQWLQGQVGTAHSKFQQVAEPLEPQGTGYYRVRAELIAVCTQVNEGSATGVSYQPITRPAHPVYSVGNKFLAWLGGANGGYNTSATGTTFSNTVQLQPGTAYGALGTPSWVKIQSGGGNFVDFSCTFCSSPTVTAKQESTGCEVYNVNIKTSYSGFRSETLYVKIDRPKRTRKVQGQIDTVEPYSGGFLAKIKYATEGLCPAQGYLRGYKLNEEFDNIDLGMTNWPYNASGTTMGSTDFLWADWIGVPVGDACGPDGDETCDPEPEEPSLPLSTVRLTRAQQTWFVGSTTPGAGIEIQRNNLDRYINHGNHSSITTPVN